MGKLRPFGYFMDSYFKKFIVLKRVGGKEGCTVKLESDFDGVKLSAEIFSNGVSLRKYIFVCYAFGEEVKVLNLESSKFSLTLSNGAKRGFSAAVLSEDKELLLYGGFGESLTANELISKADFLNYNDDVIATENYYEVESEKQSFYNQTDNSDYSHEKSSPQTKEESRTLLYENAFKNGQENYYLSIKEKLSEIIKNHEKDNELISLIPNSQFAKINYDENRFYSVGTVTDSEAVKYVCYAVKSSYMDAQPILSDFCEFIPLSPFYPLGEGYYVIFQRASTGEIVKKPN